MTTINDLCVTSSFSPDDKLPMWSNANGVTRALPLSVLTAQFLTADSINQLAASATTETFVSGSGFTPGVTTSITLANQYLSKNNVEVFFDASFQGPDQFTLVGNTLAFISPIPVGVQIVYVRGGATRLTGAPSDGTVTDAKVSTDSKLWSRINDTIDVKDFGAKGDGITDDTAAFVAALAYARTRGSAAVFIPAGTFVLGSQLAYTMPSVTASIAIVGAGAEVTNLLWAAGGGISLTLIGTMNSFHVRDLTLLTSSSEVGSALSVALTVPSVNPASTALSEITSVTFRGSDGYGLAYCWGTGISIDRASNINFTNVCGVGGAGTRGTCVNLFGTGVTIPVEFNFQMCSFYCFQYGLIYGNYVQGVTINQCNFTTGVEAIHIPAGMTALAQLAITGSQFNVSQNAVNCLSNPAPLLMTGNMVIVNSNGFGVHMKDAGLFSITGNNFFPGTIPITAATGVYIESSTAPGVITGNTFYSMTSIAVVLGAGSSSVNVQSNAYLSNGVNVVNNGTGNTVGGGSQ